MEEGSARERCAEAAWAGREIVWGRLAGLIWSSPLHEGGCCLVFYDPIWKQGKRVSHVRT